MEKKIVYETLARLHPTKPVDRIKFIANKCVGKNILDIGCYDETALIKRGTDAWLHGSIANVARNVIGLDNSPKIPPEGIQTGPNSKIIRGDGMALNFLQSEPVEVIVAGEFIEHIDQPLTFIAHLQSVFPGRKIVLSTPNGGCVSNTLLGIISREAQHPDHLHVFTYKILNTLCLRSKLKDYRIIPYQFFATEMILTSRGLKRTSAKSAEKIIRFWERQFPLLSFGYIIDATL